MPCQPADRVSGAAAESFLPIPSLETKAQLYLISDLRQRGLFEPEQVNQ